MVMSSGMIIVDRSQQERANFAERIRQHRLTTARVRESLMSTGEPSQSFTAFQPTL